MTITPQTNATLADIAQVILDNDDFVLCGHVSPDGDCLGCQLALWYALKALGKRAACVLVRDEPIEAGLQFMPGIGEMVPADRYSGPCEVFVGLDVPTRERIGAATTLLDKSKTSITVDHHAADSTMCDHVHVDPDCASASMLVWDLVKLLMDEPPHESALCAYVGLLTDTGGFRFQNSDARAFEVASELVEIGVDAAEVAVWVFQSRPLASLKLEGLTIERVILLAGGAAAISYVTQDDFERLGATKADAEPLVDCVRSIAGTRIACMLREQESNVRGSLRSKDETDVSLLAREFGGGGHKAAAGFTLNMPISQALEHVSGKIVDLLKDS